MKFNHIRTSPNYSQSNGMVEHAIQNMKNLKKSVADNTDFYLSLLEYCNMLITEKIPSSVQIIFNRELKGTVSYKNILLRL